LTLILKAKPQLENLYTINGTIALRMPDKEWLLELINFTGPLSATSANPSGAEYINEEEKIVDSFGKKVNYFIFGKNIENSSSSIIDITKDAPIVLRSGSVEPDIKLMVK
jgi:L-threonylcarbamoyladenylate synthase